MVPVRIFVVIVVLHLFVLTNNMLSDDVVDLSLNFNLSTEHSRQITRMWFDAWFEDMRL